MSTRRSTRAASRASRGATPAVNEEPPNTPAPRRTARRSGVAHPAISAKSSSAYGSNTVPESLRMTGLPASEGVDDVLERLLNQPTPRRETSPEKSHSNGLGESSRRLRSYTESVTSKSRSFQDETGIFGTAGIDSTHYSSDEDEYQHDMIREEDEEEEEEESIRDEAPVPEVVNVRRDDTQNHVEGMAREDLNATQNTGAHEQPTALAHIESAVKKFLAWFNVATPLLVVVLFFLTFALLLSSSTQLAPSSLVTSGNLSISKEFLSIQHRLITLEREVRNMKHRFTEFDLQSIERLARILPEEIMMRRGSNGKLVLTDEFFRALQERVISEDEYEDIEFTTKKVTGFWTKYITKNKNAVDAFKSEQLKKAFPQLLQENQVATKAEVIATIHSLWNDNKDQIGKEMAGLRQKLDAATDSIKSLKGASEVTKDDVARTVEEVLRKHIPQAQLDALSQSLLTNTNYGMTHLNFFSKGSGAIIIPQHTSPDFLPPANNVGWLTKFRNRLQGNPVPVPNSPVAALLPWQEYGDCWCAATDDPNGTPMSLTVIVKDYILPEQVVVEHILPEATFEPGSAPKDMELFAFIANPAELHDLTQLSRSLFPDSGWENVPHGFVRIAEWTYDATSKNYVQAFDVGMDMKALDIPIKKLMVRAKNNWSDGKVGYTCFYRIRMHGEHLKGVTWPRYSIL